MQIRWLTFGAEVNPFKRYNPFRPFVHRFNAWTMNRYISRILNERITHFQTEKQTKSILDLALAAYLTENPQKEATKDGGMDSTFKTFAMSQIKLFLFSGHDTTSSSICYLFYVLACHPHALSLVCAEHDAVLGSDPDQAAAMIEKNPFLLNQLPYTLAVIKETLRLYPAVSSTRAGRPDCVVVEGPMRFPTDGFLVWANPQSIQRDPTYWPQSDVFLPNRWLAPVGDPLHPVKGAWRPFEHGPRNCIGQELAMIEMKVIMVMTLRKFDVRPAYEEVDRQRNTKEHKTVYGERGYQVQRAQPSEDLPCRVGMK